MSYTQPALTTVAESSPTTLFMRDSALERACERIIDAGLAGASWAIFPEGYIPDYPLWVWTFTPSDNSLINAFWAEAIANTVQIPSAVTDRLCGIAQRAQVNVAIGVIERAGTEDTTIVYNTVLFITAQGRISGIYRAPCEAGQQKQHEWISEANEAPADRSKTVSHIGGI